MKKKKYDLIYSIGRDCACAGYLKKNHLRSFSGPFDWLTNAGFEKRFELLLNDFSDFMEPKDFKFLPKNPNIFNDPNCDYYENVKTTFYYYHDFPINVPFDQVFDSISEKYSRRIKRFYEKIKTSEKVLLVWFSHYHDTPDEIVVNLCNQFCAKMQKEIDFLIIEHKNGCSEPIAEKLTANITRYRLHTIVLDSDNNPTTFGDIELCNKIFQNFQLKMPFYLKCKKQFFKIISEIVCICIFNKENRKKIRKKIREYYE